MGEYKIKYTTLEVAPETLHLELEKVHKALLELIKYLDILANVVKDEDLKKLKEQMTELKDYIEIWSNLI